jgi:hypothetical protein
MAGIFDASLISGMMVIFEAVFMIAAMMMCLALGVAAFVPAAELAAFAMVMPAASRERWRGRSNHGGNSSAQQNRHGERREFHEKDRPLSADEIPCQSPC